MRFPWGKLLFGIRLTWTTLTKGQGELFYSFGFPQGHKHQGLEPLSGLGINVLLKT